MKQLNSGEVAANASQREPGNEEDVGSDCGNQISFRAELKDKMVLKGKNSVSRSRGSSLFDSAGHKFVLSNELE